jgi:lipopolysaccharide export system permease protein
LSSPAVRILDRYLLREWAKVFGLCLLGFGGLILISHCYNRIPDLERWGLSFGTSVEYLALLMVGSIPMLLPISLLISVIFTLGALNRNQELAAIRAAGVGLWRLTAPLWAAGVACALLLVALNAYWIPDALERQREISETAQFDAIRAQGKATLPAGEIGLISFDNTRARRLWLISRMGFSTGQAFEVDVHLFDEQGRETRCISARFAEFRKIDGRWRWVFRQGRDLRFDPKTGALLAQPEFKELAPGFDEDPEVMLFATREPSRLSLREVSRFVEHAGQNPTGSNAAYAMRYHAILSAPAICFVVIAVAIPFAVVGGRVSPMVGVAKTFGLFLAFYLLTSFCAAFGDNGAIPPMVAAWLPTVLVAAWAVPKLRAVN